MKEKNNKKAAATKQWSAPEVKRSPSRFRNPIGKYKIRRGPECIACGKCAELCPEGVHVKAGAKMEKPRDFYCLGFCCRNNAGCQLLVFAASGYKISRG